MGIDLDAERVTGTWRARQLELHTHGRSGTTAQGAGGDRPAVSADRCGVQLEIRGAGELEHSAFRESCLVGGLVDDGGTGDLSRRGVARAAGAADLVGLGGQAEGVAGNGGIRVGFVTGLEADVQAQVDAAEADLGVVAVRIELAALGSFQGDVIAAGVGDLELGAAGELDAVRFAAAETVVVGDTARHLAIGQADPPIIGGGCGQAGLAATGIERLFEGVVPGLVGRQAKHIADLQLQLGLVALVGVGAIGVAYIRRDIALGAGEQVLAVLIRAVHQGEQLLLQRVQLGGIGLAVSVGEAGVAGAHCQFVDPLQDGANGFQGALGTAQGIAHIDDVVAVLSEHVLLLLELQQACGADRVVLGGAHANVVGGLLLGLHRVGEVALIVGLVGVVELRSRDAYAHDLRLLKDC
ncbi:hypothetical protein D9M71_420940 [compost metagenome]